MIYLFSILFGLVFGSFANVCILRLPSEDSIRFPRSHCPFCHKPLRWIDNIPLISFIILRGRCHFCGHPISWQYPVIEGTMAALFLIAAVWFRESLVQVVAVDILSFYLLTISVIDYRHRIIPDELSLSLLVIALCFSFLNPYLANTGLRSFAESLLSGLAGGLGMLFLAWVGEKIFKQEALGGGDIKLVAALGAFLGWGGAFGSLLLGSLTGGLLGLALILMNKKKRSETIPFGPFLSFGAYCTAFFPSWWRHVIFP